MGEYPVALGIVLVLVLGAEFVNGWTDAPNAIATVVSTRVLTPIQAVVMASILNILGAMSGTAVAATIGKGIVETQVINLTTVGAAMVGIIFWGTFAWQFGLPTSQSHSLVAGLAGAGLATAGPSVLLWVGWSKVLLGLVISTFLGFGMGLIIMLAVAWFFQDHPPSRVRRLFGKLQILSAAFMAFSHGSNDGQKFIGVFTMALVLAGVIPEFHVSLEVILVCGTVMGIGTSVGGWRIVRTMGLRIVKLEPPSGFSAETAAACCIEVASRLGIPLSTTHTINTAIVGVGASKRLSAVRWGVVREVVAAWVLTFPVCGVIAWLVVKLLEVLK
jgi:PiT family inorganic phosphate transporter